MYNCLCHTCDETELLEDFDRAQEFFLDHADRGCEVELVNVKFSTTDQPGESSHPEGRARDAQPADE